MRAEFNIAVLLWAQALVIPSGGAYASAQARADSSFLLTTADPRRSPSPFIGNGRLGVVVPALGIGAAPAFKAGLYEHGPGDVPRIVATPAWNGVEVFDGRDWIALRPPPDSSVRAYTQVLDMRTGTVHTSYDWVNGGRRTSLKVEQFVSRADPDLAALRVEVIPQQAGRMRVRFALTGWPPPKRLALASLARADPSWKPEDIWYPGQMLVRSRESRREPRGARLSMTSSPVGRTSSLAQAATITWAMELRNPQTNTTAAGETALVEIAFDASPGSTYAFSQLVSTFSSDETQRPMEQARREIDAARTRGFDRLAADNAQAWLTRWETDIEIEGNAELQRVVRSMLFYLLCSADSGTMLGIPPMGLSSAGYYGHIFWDSDTWMFPSLLLTHPDVAQSLVAFRTRTLPAARENAKLNGFRGAMYPWEADERGVETTPHFAVQNARSEIHVNGDVALAQWQYYQATGDSSWLASDGFPVIRETADFWVSRSSCDTPDELCHIKNVVSVAEGLIGVTDDAYTNAVARKNLEIATAASKRLGKPADPRWALLASKLHLPYDSASQFFRTYQGAPDSTLGWVTPLLAYPLSVPMSPRAKRAQLEQAFANLVKEGPGAMMGSTILAVGAAELNDRAMMDSLLPFSYQKHMKGPFLMLSETPTNNAVNFVTGAGGFLQQVIFGWTGYRLAENGLEPAHPAVLPSSVKRLVLRNITVRGKKYDITVDGSGRRMTPGSAKPPR
jgi:trehalose/maltose hydrolase-like predicted phosphorylase